MYNRDTVYDSILDFSDDVPYGNDGTTLTVFDLLDVFANPLQQHDYPLGFLNGTDLLHHQPEQVLVEPDQQKKTKQCHKPQNIATVKERRRSQRSAFSKRNPDKSGKYINRQRAAKIAEHIGVDLPEDYRLSTGVSYYDAVWRQIQL